MIDSSGDISQKNLSEKKPSPEEKGNTIKFVKNFLLKNPFASSKGVIKIQDTSGHVQHEPLEQFSETGGQKSCLSKRCSSASGEGKNTLGKKCTSAIRRHRTNLFGSKERAHSVDPSKRYSLPSNPKRDFSLTLNGPIYANAAQLLGDCTEDSESLSSSGLSGSYSSLFDSNGNGRKLDHRFNCLQRKKCPVISSGSLLLKRHLSVEPIYANCSPLTPDYELDINQLEPLDTSNHLHGLSASVSSILDYKMLMRKLEQKQNPSLHRHQHSSLYQPKKSSLVSSKSMFNFSRNLFNSKNSGDCDNQCPENSSSLMSRNLSRLKTSRTHSQLASMSGNCTNSNLPAGDKSESLLYLTSKPISVSLLDAINNQLKEDAIDLTREPYSDSSGFCGIPPGLVQRYSDELQRDIYEVADALDHIRLAALLLKGRRGVPNDFLADACVGLTCEQANYDNLNTWLTSLGLPMYDSSLRSHGFHDLNQVSRMRENDFMLCGISIKSHLRSLATAVGALNMKI
ncbi:SAM and SH3 domain-containing protein 1 [Halotydeus destructor]|nr:SAM and SH3 domain-containing protein 1 [Halotydeus destructor]